MREKIDRRRPTRRKGKESRIRAAQERQVKTYLKAGWKIEKEPPHRLCVTRNTVVMSKDKGWHVWYVTIY